MNSYLESLNLMVGFFRDSLLIAALHVIRKGHTRNLPGEVELDGGVSSEIACSRFVPTSA